VEEIEEILKQFRFRAMQEKQKAAANSVASKSSFYPNKLLTNNMQLYRR